MAARFGRLGLAAACLAAAGCERDEFTRFQVEGARYAVPAAAVRSIRYEPPGFVRIKEPESPVELVYDARLQNRTGKRGAPLLFSINDGEYPRLAYRETPRGALVVCRVAVAAPRGGCGTALRYRGATWTILFPDGRLAEADDLRSRARDMLNRYLQ